MTVATDGKEYKCKDCKWLSDIRRTYYGNECKNPEKQAKWENQKYLWMGELRSKRARYKYPSALACKKFEAKDERTMDTV